MLSQPVQHLREDSSQLCRIGVPNVKIQLDQLAALECDELKVLLGLDRVSLDGKARFRLNRVLGVMARCLEPILEFVFARWNDGQMN